MGSLVTVTAPFAEPIDRTEAKNHLRVTTTDEDALVDILIGAARMYAEDTGLGRALVAQTLDFYLDEFPGGDIVLPRPPLVSVSSITYLDTAGASQTLAASKYIVDTKRAPGRIGLAYGESWPSTYGQVNDIVIRFIAGYLTPFIADASSDVLTLKGRTYSNNTVVRISNSGGALPAPLAVDTDYYVVQASGSTIKLSSTSGGSVIDVTSAGTGTHFIGVLPKTYRQGLLVHIGDLFENRETVVIGSIVQHLATIDRLYADRIWDSEA